MTTKTVTWQDVADVYEEDRCDPDCPWLKRCSQYHPYGMGSAEEVWFECVLQEEKGSPDDCPRATPKEENDDHA